MHHDKEVTMKREKLFKMTKTGLLICATILLGFGLAQAKSLYVIADIDGNPTPIQTYDIQGPPTYLVYQAKQGVPNWASGAVGLAIDTTNKKLFVTYEDGNKIQMLDATNFKDLGTTTAPNASNLAGIAVDQGKNKIYTVDRNTAKLYVYDWNNATNTLTLVSGAPFTLPIVKQSYGIALDETRGRLYVGDASTTTIRYFNTTGWTEAGSFTLAKSGQTPMGIAVDTQRNIIYTGNAYPSAGGKGMLVKYDLNSGTETFYTLPGASSVSDCIVGVAVDEDTGYVYTTTGNQSSGGTDTLIVFDSSLNVLKNDLGDLGNPTGLAIPRAQISYNPLNFSKKGPSTVTSGSNMDYTLCFDNINNSTPVTGVTITDTLPSGITFVSATGGGTFSNGTVTWNIGTLAAGAAQSCVKLTVKVTATSGTVTNNATIKSNETPPTTQGATTTIGGTPGNTITNNATIKSNETPPTTQGATTTVSGGPGGCQYFNEDFSGQSGNSWATSHGNWYLQGGKLNVDQIDSGYVAVAESSFLPSDYFTVDVDVEVVSPGQGGAYYAIYPFTTGDVLFEVDGRTVDGVGAVIFVDSGNAYLLGLDVEADQWYQSTKLTTSGSVTSIGVAYSNNAITLRINKQNTSLKFSTTLPFMVIDTIWLFAAGTGTHVRFDNVCANPIGGGCTISSCKGTVPTTAQVGVPINVQATANLSNCGTPQYYWQFGETTARIPGQNIPYTYSTPGTWDWYMQVEADGQSCVDHGTITVTGQGGETVSTPTTPSGPASGAPGTSYTYSTGGSSSNLGHSVQYFIDWGDGTNSGWLPVGTTSASKSWPAGTYNLKAQARCSIHTSIVSGWSGTLTVVIKSGGTTGTATRDLPNCYPPSGSFLVTITVTPASTTQNYAVEDAPPAGWTVSSINENGQWDNVTKKVKWGPFFDHNNRTLTYMVTPPPNETGTKSFSGTASFDGVNVAIGGKVSLDKCVNICHPADTNCDYRMVISEVTAYGAAWKTGQTWQNPPNPIPIEYVTNAGYLWKVGEVYHYDATKTPPGCWVPGAAAGGQSLRNRSPLKTQVALGTGTATRELPNCYTPSGATSVSITVVPGQGTQVYAVEDAPPAGWTVSDINESGGWDNVNKKVKWGPFFDQNNRTLTYKATPPSGESGAKTFSGTVSYDGTNVTMGGDSTLGVCTAQQYTLTVSKSGTGSGTVTSSPAGIDCGSDCTETYSKVQKVKLTAKADTNSGFDGWSGGGCLGTKTCQVNVNGEITVTASFAAKIPDIVVSQDSLDFGGVKVGKSLSKTLKITNNGTGDLTITTVTGLEGTNFSISGSSSITIKSKKSYNLKVAFKPTSTGSKTATLKISSNDPHTPALEIPLSGTGQ
jgi:uncharacterized repeat protein (TIGR01451 family)